jgi:hypothetical protein
MIHMGDWGVETELSRARGEVGSSPDLAASLLLAAIPAVQCWGQPITRRRRQGTETKERLQAAIIIYKTGALMYNGAEDGMERSVNSVRNFFCTSRRTDASPD